MQTSKSNAIQTVIKYKLSLIFSINIGTNKGFFLLIESVYPTRTIKSETGTFYKVQHENQLFKPLCVILEHKTETLLVNIAMTGIVLCVSFV